MQEIYQINDNLREIYFGQWEGRLHTEIERLWEEERRNFWHFPHLYKPVGGETEIKKNSRKFVLKGDTSHYKIEEKAI